MEKVSKVIWTKRSSFDLRKIFDFNTELKDIEKAGEIVDSIIDSVERSLIDKFDVGAKDQQFAHKGDYKKLLFGMYKVTFRSENGIAYVVRVFDMRQHPDKNR